MNLVTLLLSVLLVAGTGLATGLLVTTGLIGMARLERAVVPLPHPVPRPYRRR
jgi:hypothetical protein